MPTLIQKIPTFNSGWEWGNEAPHLSLVSLGSQTPQQPQPVPHVPQRCCLGGS